MEFYVYERCQDIMSSMPNSTDAIVDKSVIRVGLVTITASRCVQCIGVCTDRHLDTKKHVSQTISASSFYLRNINQISRFLARPTNERVVNVIITSRLDYCNALLYGTSAVNIARLQRIHNSSARLILRSPRSDSATPLLRKLHWLHIVCIVHFKLLVLTYTCTTTRQCIGVNSCARINRQEHCALRTTAYCQKLT